MTISLKKLFLAIYERPPGYVDGQTSIGLFEAIDIDSAKMDAVKAMGVWADDAEKYIKVIPTGRMITIATKRTNYDE